MKMMIQEFHEVLMSTQSEEHLDCDLVAKLAELFVPVHAISESLVARNHSEYRRGLVKEKDLISKPRSIQKLLKRLVNRWTATAVLVEIDPESNFRTCLLRATYFANQLPETITLSAKRRLIHYIGGLKLNSSPKLCLNGSPEDASTNVNVSLENSSGYKKKIPPRSISVIRRELPESTLGWPLLPRRTHPSQEVLRRSEAIDMPIVERVLCLPNRTSELNLQTKFHFNSQMNNSVVEVPPSENESITEHVSSSTFSVLPNESAQSRFGWPFLLKNTRIILDSSNLTAPTKMPKRLELVLKQFSYKDLKRATSHFSSENLIGEGGCSNVYKGYLSNHKPVAVKILKQYKEAWNDFSLEVDIMSSLKHKHITPLIGVCAEDNYLILVYEFLSKGSLEESLQGDNQKSVLPWKARFKVAVAVADALDYLHNKCSKPVIHRDVKSSNILLSNEFQPQLSDFGLAIWKPVDSTGIIQTDIVGTFGYIAPEYVMRGRISEKTDVYSFGIVLLELLTGKKPVSCIKGQESLVKWATPLLERGHLRKFLDKNLDRNFDAVQMKRMILAATLCTKQSARLRPRVSQIIELLRGKRDEREWIKSYIDNVIDSSNEEVEETFPEVVHRPRFDFSLLHLDDEAALLTTVDTMPLQNTERKCRLKLKDYLQQQPE